MLFSLKKKEEIFYDLFDETVVKVVEAAEALDDLMNNYTDIIEKVCALKDIEHDCDVHIHKIMKALNASFITPIDREDIYMIAKEMDNIVDTIEEAANRFELFHVSVVREEAKIMGGLIVECVKELKVVVNEMRRMKRSKLLKVKIIEVNRIENEGDVVYRKAIKSLFENETNALEVIKWKQIYEFLEDSIDSCENVANILEGVVMKHA
jgi:predicted phosphate transport protein (TIGR00153 family)